MERGGPQTTLHIQLVEMDQGGLSSCASAKWARERESQWPKGCEVGDVITRSNNYRAACHAAQATVPSLRSNELLRGGMPLQKV